MFGSTAENAYFPSYLLKIYACFMKIILRNPAKIAVDADFVFWWQQSEKEGGSTHYDNKTNMSSCFLCS
jgi:hypothetical protein